MKKFLIIGAIALALIMPIAGSTTSISSQNTKKTIINSISNDEFTHTVLAEYVTLTTCPYCVTASEQLHSIYESGDLDFHYVSLVWDANALEVGSRCKELEATSAPDVYFDGGYRNILGAQPSEQQYRDAIAQSGIRELPDIDVDVDVTWTGGGVLKIAVTVTNNEAEDFNGHLRTYIVEKDSRWNKVNGGPYNNAVLDIPIDRNLAVVSQQNQPQPLGDTYTFTRTWFGILHGFGDITQDNIMVIAAVFDADTDYVVQTASAEPTSNSDIRIFNQNSIFPLFFQILQRLLNTR